MVLCDMWFFCTIKKKNTEEQHLSTSMRKRPRRAQSRLGCPSLPQLGTGTVLQQGGCSSMQGAPGGASWPFLSSWDLAHRPWTLVLKKFTLFISFSSDSHLSHHPIHEVFLLGAEYTKKKKKRQKSSLKKVFLSQKSLQCSRDSCTAV